MTQTITGNASFFLFLLTTGSCDKIGKVQKEKKNNITTKTDSAKSTLSKYSYKK